ncbi:hypothetical protein [Paratractidigestivibacter sp.]|uniref:hypothetical protein n=1 Tax=Paratractidigestivibacter sp. TaxID=2847316 RepID=UPI002AC9DA31|nr:hypothetical protein [Paratractidigestivibacter sp.]
MAKKETLGTITDKLVTAGAETISIHRHYDEVIAGFGIYDEHKTFSFLPFNHGTEVKVSLQWEAWTGEGWEQIFDEFVLPACKIAPFIKHVGAMYAEQED